MSRNNNWWERSPNADNSNYFANVSANGNANNNNNATNANGVSFGFPQIQNRTSSLLAKAVSCGEGVNNPPIWVNRYADAAGWMTLLAWILWLHSFHKCDKHNIFMPIVRYYCIGVLKNYE